MLPPYARGCWPVYAWPQAVDVLRRQVLEVVRVAALHLAPLGLKRQFARQRRSQERYSLHLCQQAFMSWEKQRLLRSCISLGLHARK